MDRRDPNAVVAANVSAVRTSRGLTISDLSDATHIPAPRFTGKGEFTFGELLVVGGVLSVSPGSLMAGVPSA